MNSYAYIAENASPSRPCIWSV